MEPTRHHRLQRAKIGPVTLRCYAFRLMIRFVFGLKVSRSENICVRSRVLPKKPLNYKLKGRVGVDSLVLVAKTHHFSVSSLLYS